MGADDLKTFLGSSTMFGDFVKLHTSPAVNAAISLGIALAILNANIAIILMIARQLYSTGRDHIWPTKISYALVRIHPKFNSPWVATLSCGVIASVACFIDINTLFVIIGSSLVFVYIMLCIAALVARRKNKTADSHYRMPLFPLPPVLALVGMIYVLYADYLDTAVGRPSLWATVGMIIVSATYYFAVLRRKGDWVLRSPDDE